jgi:hypothetical protein
MRECNGRLLLWIFSETLVIKGAFLSTLANDGILKRNFIKIQKILDIF